MQPKATPEESTESGEGETKGRSKTGILTMDLEMQNASLGTKLEFVPMPAAGSGINEDNHEEYGKAGNRRMATLGERKLKAD